MWISIDLTQNLMKADPDPVRIQDNKITILISNHNLKLRDYLLI